MEAFDASTPGATKPIASWVVQAPSPVAPQVSLVIDPASLGAAKLVTFSVGPRNGAPGKKLSAVGDAGRSAALRFAAPAAVGGKWSVCADAPPPALKADGIQIARTVDEAGPVRGAGCGCTLDAGCGCFGRLQIDWRAAGHARARAWSWPLVVARRLLGTHPPQTTVPRGVSRLADAPLLPRPLTCRLFPAASSPQGPLTLRIPNPDPSLKACVTSYEVR